MGLADILAGSRSTEAQLVGSVFGGQTAQDRRQNFADKEFPAIAAMFEQAKDTPSVDRALSTFHAAAMKAGITPAEMKELTSVLVPHAMKNVGADEIQKMVNEFSPQTTPLTPQVAPEGQGQQLDVARTGFTPQTVPGRLPTTADAFKLNEIFARTGVQPVGGLAGLLEAPGKIAEQEQKLKSQKMTDDAIQSLPTTPPEGGQVSPQQMGLINRPGLTQFVPQREKPEDPLLEERRALLKQETATSAARGRRADRPPAEPKASAAGGTQAMKDFISIGGDPQDEAAFMDFLAKRAKATRKPTEMELYLERKKAGGGTPRPTAAGTGKKRSLEEIARDAFK